MKLIVSIFLLIVAFSVNAQTAQTIVGKWEYKGLFEREKYYEKTALKHDETYAKLLYIFKESGDFEKTGFRNDEIGKWHFEGNLLYLKADGGTKQLFEIQSFENGKMVAKVGLIPVILERELVPGEEMVVTEEPKKSVITVIETTKEDQTTKETESVKEEVKAKEEPEEKPKFGKDEKFLYTIKDNLLLSDFSIGVRFLPEYRNNKPPYYQFTVYDKAKKIVFETDNPLTGWDGIRKDTKKLIKKGIYTWTIEYKIKQRDEFKVAKGTLNVN